MSQPVFSTVSSCIDPSLAQFIQAEQDRQQNQIEMIASENIVSKAVLEVQGSILTNKYAEGYPQKRYYGGCVHVDSIETLAIERACQLFGCVYANVQPHSGSQANQSVFLALLQPGDTILGMSLAAGGHLTHGAPPNLSGKWFRGISYGVDPITHQIDMEAVYQIAAAHRPRLIIAGGSAYPRQIDFEKFRQIADAIGAYLMVDMAHFAGLVAAQHYPSPFPYAHVVTTTTHKTLRGPRGGMILSQDQSLGKKLNSAVFPGLQGGPLMHVIAAKAVCFYEALSTDFKTYAARVLENASALNAVFQKRGFSVITGGTDTHLLLLDVSTHNLTGQEAETCLELAGITCNKNGIPFDPLPPTKTSGIRLGTPAGTSRGLGCAEFHEIAHWICDILESASTPMADAVAQKVKKNVFQLCKRFPIYGLA